MLILSQRVTIPARELQFQAIRAQGPGGQHVNKTATAVQLIFDVRASEALPEIYKQRILASSSHLLTAGGKILIKSQGSRSQELNRREALARLKQLIDDAMVVAKARKATRPTRASQKRRVEQKRRQGQTKQLRQRKPGAND